jgi:ubiquinone/menaquinone biosynthesis C-methylase UbiE
MSAETTPWRESVALYDEMAPSYDAVFEEQTYRRAYDLLAGEYVGRQLPTTPGVVVDAGCGTGRWAARWLELGHKVIGIEQSPQMIGLIRRRRLGPSFRLVEASMAEAQLEDGTADLVVAMASLQYLADPAAAMSRFVRWLKPGGRVCVYTDSLVAIVLELFRTGRPEEALLRLETRRGEFRVGDAVAELHLFNRESLLALLTAAGLTDVSCHGLLVMQSAWDKQRCTEAFAVDEAGYLELERRLTADPAMADAGKHIIADGRKPFSVGA